MEIKPISSRMYGFLVLYDMHTKFYHKVLAGISDEDAIKRLNTKANHISWLAGSLLQERYELAMLFGVDLRPSAHELFKHHQGIKENTTYPALASDRNEWDEISPILRERLLNATEEELDKILDFPVEQMRFPMFEMVSFNIYREANVIGQIALWRRLLGYEAMSYM